MYPSAVQRSDKTGTGARLKCWSAARGKKAGARDGDEAQDRKREKKASQKVRRLNAGEASK
jgi:hypothetical protein